MGQVLDPDLGRPRRRQCRTRLSIDGAPSRSGLKRFARSESWVAARLDHATSLSPHAVSVSVSFASVHSRSPSPQRPGIRLRRRPQGLHEHDSKELESVLGATPHEFESRILRHSPESRNRRSEGGFGLYRDEQGRRPVASAIGLLLVPGVSATRPRREHSRTRSGGRID
jgi:hypothetical protein